MPDIRVVEPRLSMNDCQYLDLLGCYARTPYVWPADNQIRLATKQLRRKGLDPISHGIRSVVIVVSQYYTRSSKCKRTDNHSRN